MAAKEISVKKYVVRLSGEERERLETLTDTEPDRLAPLGPASACRPPRGFGGGGALLRRHK
jgi:hypothetical protein